MDEIHIPLLRGIAAGLKRIGEGWTARRIDEAADEIERLRREVAELKEERDD